MTTLSFVLIALNVFTLLSFFSLKSAHNKLVKEIECRFKHIKDKVYENNKDAQHYFKELTLATKELAEKSGYTITHSHEEEINPFAPFFKKPLIKTICQLHLEKFKKLNSKVLK